MPIADENISFHSMTSELFLIVFNCAGLSISHSFVMMLPGKFVCFFCCT